MSVLIYAQGIGTRMGKKQYDGVIELVHYNQSGKIDWVRAYLKRGAVFSDRLIIDRTSLVSQLNSGKKFMTGKRVEYLGGTFQVYDPLRLIQKNGEYILVVGDTEQDHDLIKGVPII